MRRRKWVKTLLALSLRGKLLIANCRQPVWWNEDNCKQWRLKTCFVPLFHFHQKLSIFSINNLITSRENEKRCECEAIIQLPLTITYMRRNSSKSTSYIISNRLTPEDIYPRRVTFLRIHFPAYPLFWIFTPEKKASFQPTKLNRTSLFLIELSRFSIWFFLSL